MGPRKSSALDGLRLRKRNCSLSDATDALLEQGWSIKRQGKGSHVVWGKGTHTFIVPRKLKVGLVNDLISAIEEAGTVDTGESPDDDEEES